MVGEKGLARRFTKGPLAQANGFETLVSPSPPQLEPFHSLAETLVDPVIECDEDRCEKPATHRTDCESVPIHVVPPILDSEVRAFLGPHAPPDYFEGLSGKAVECKTPRTVGECSLPTEPRLESSEYVPARWSTLGVPSESLTQFYLLKDHQCVLSPAWTRSSDRAVIDRSR